MTDDANINEIRDLLATVLSLRFPSRRDADGIAMREAFLSKIPTQFRGACVLRDSGWLSVTHAPWYAARTALLRRTYLHRLRLALWSGDRTRDLEACLRAARSHIASEQHKWMRVDREVSDLPPDKGGGRWVADRLSEIDHVLQRIDEVLA